MLAQNVVMEAIGAWRRSELTPPGSSARAASAHVPEHQATAGTHGAGHATDEEIREAALQFVRKVSGFQAPSARHEEAFTAAVDEVADSSKRLSRRSRRPCGAT